MGLLVNQSQQQYCSAQRPTHLSGFYKKERGAGYKAKHEQEEKVTHGSSQPRGYMSYFCGFLNGSSLMSQQDHPLAPSYTVLSRSDF